jgi:N-(2-amino-2-carboxyethyl)-L-glutamate synthase
VKIQAINTENVVSENPLATKLKEILPWIGKSPLKKLHFDSCNLFVKLESNNYSGSVKDWAAYYIVSKAIESGEINEGTTIVESSSGNFAIALAYICKKIGVRFIPVIDPNINGDYERVLHMLCEKVVKVRRRDHKGGYLLTRIETVKELCAKTKNSFWTNQYENENNYKAYFYGLGPEIGAQFTHLEYVFIAVSTCGTITGLSMRLKELYPSMKIIAVDVEGSVIFGGDPGPRYVPGIGAGKVPENLRFAFIDEVMHISQADIIDGCHRLMREQLILAGGSSGALYFAIQKFFALMKDVDPSANVLFISPDGGRAYLDTIYNPKWQSKILQQSQK